MTGPEHYTEAERLLGEAPTRHDDLTAIQDRALVHATLALAAATALSGTPYQSAAGEAFVAMPDTDTNAWIAVAGTDES